MKGSIVKRSKTSWSLVVDQGRDPEGRRKQKWVRFAVSPALSQRENTKIAQAALAKLLHQTEEGTFVDPSRLTLIAYLRSWHATKVAGLRRPETARVYRSMIETHIAPAPIASLRLQAVRTSHLEALYQTVKLAPATVTVLHAIVRKALKTAVRDGLIVANPAAAVENRPKPSKDHSAGARLHCWTAAEARAVLSAAQATGPQVAAFLAVLLDTGCRKSEALGLSGRTSIWRAGP